MPNQTSNMTALRGRHRVGVYVSAMIGSVVLTGTVSATPASANALNVAYTLVSGSAADVRPGMRVVVSNGGLFKGFMSIRFAGTISSSNLPVREFSLGELIVESGDTITVYDDLVLTDKLVSADETFAPDHTAYVDQNSNPAPVAVSGGWWAGWLGDDGTVEVPFAGSGAYVTDPDSGGSLTHAWSCASGTWDDATAANPTLTLSAAGSYVVFHAVTDVSNGKTETQLIRVRVHDDADPPYDCELANVEGDPQTGFRTSFKLYENVSLTVIPDGTPVIVWSEEWMDGTEQSYGAVVPSRSHIICTGFFRRDRSSGDASGDNIEFEVTAPIARLAELPGFSKALERSQTPDTWQEVKTLTVKRGLVKLLRDYTNALEMFDLVFDGFSDADYVAFYLQKQNPYEQLRELADSRDARIICDRTGRFEVQGRLELSALADRGAITTTITLEDDDILEYEISREHNRTLETYRARGFTAGTDANVVQPTFARAPASPARGNVSATIEKLIVDDVSDLYARCARRMAWDDSVYFDADGVQRHAPSVRLTLFGNYAQIFQFYREWVQLDGMVNLRGVDLSDFRFIVQRVSVDYAGMTATTTIELRAETHAPPEASVDDTPAAETYAPPELPISFPPLVSLPNADFLLGRGTYNLAFIADDGYLYFCDTRPTLPVWERVSLASLGMVGLPVMAIIDAFDFANGVLVTSTKAYRFTDIGSNSRALSNEYALRYSSGYRSLQSERGAEGFFVCVSHQDDQRIDLNYTLNGGVSWTQVANIGGDWPGTGGDNIYPGCYVFAGTPGKVLFGALDGTGTTSTGRMKVSTDFGATNSNFDSNTVVGFMSDIHCPFQNEAVVYSGGIVSAGYSDYRLYKTVAGVRSDVSPSDGSEYYGPVNQFGVKTCDVDPLSVLLFGQNRDTGTIKNGVWLARNGGLATASFSPIITPTTSMPYRAGAFAGDDPNTCWLWGNNGAIAQCKNLNATAPLIRDLSGNLSSFTSPAVGRILNIFGV